MPVPHPALEVGGELLTQEHQRVRVHDDPAVQQHLVAGRLGETGAAGLGLPCAIHRERTESRDQLGHSMVLAGLRRDTLAEFLGTFPTRRGESLLDRFHPTRAVVDTLAQLGYC
ncbi:hypothetical protein SAMN05421810_10364 [Amycolatopsis arida]|uniref:Uncharacterized protein n=1 Tax=Amycolatopsis arida TaxID=587909 RepID=A0A1I5S9W4_9PSEU|nr:hypothetical protein CLV69_11664 [Amycolatopsis arida]SFP67505.1 hypothetical protein SAMN05421810_10364 [Amycolatopsis arida]